MPDGTRVQEWGSFVYGYSVTIGPDGKPQFREFGNLKPGTRFGRPNIDVKEEREPLVDIMATNGEVNVIAELPGVDKDDINLRGTEGSLTISVDTPQRRYYKEVDLPARIDIRGVKSRFKNGVLEVTIPKKEEKKSKDERIQIE